MATQGHGGEIQEGPRRETDKQVLVPTPDWRLGTRMAFRFCFVYFGVYILITQMLQSLLAIPDLDNAPQLDWLWPLRQIISWVAVHVFHVHSALVITGSGSGDKTYDWVEAFCLLVLAVGATGIWSALDSKRKNYVALHKWFRVFVRFALGSTMFSYGFVKIIPLQMPFPFLTRLLEPFGNFSPMGVLWTSIGASPGYEMFAGCAEILGGLLVLIPRTTTLGALICLADATQVLALNMTYDVPVKLFSFHLVLLALILLAPDARRLANFLLRDEATGPSTQPPLFRGRRGNRIALAVQILFTMYLVVMNLYGARLAWKEFGGGAPKSALYGIWDVEQLSIDGQIRSPLLTDYDRWRRVIFDFPTFVTIQRMDESFFGYATEIDVKDGTISLTKGGDKTWKGKLTFQRPAQDQLILEGVAGEHKIHAQLRLMGRNKFLLLSRGFHWIEEYPFNR
ncbi:MAG: DoxX family protein [Candidatus Acidiferrales bacterium]